MTFLERLNNSTGDLLLRIGGGLLLLVAGLVVVVLVVRVLERLLRRRRVDVLAERIGAHDVLASMGLDRSLVKAIGFVLRLTLSVVVVVAALALLGLGPLGEALNEVVLFLPRLLLAFALVLVGLVIGELAQRYVERWTAQLSLRGPLDEVVQIMIVTVFVIMALSALGVPTGLLISLTVVLLGGLALTLALAFGFGSREVARAVSTGRYVAASFAVGQAVEVAGVRGEIRAIEATSTVLEDSAGRTVRVPNHLFLETVVTIDPDLDSPVRS